MTTPLKKSFENVMKKIIPTASRAVNVNEAKTIEPNIISQTSTSMPWRGWLSSFFVDKLGPNRYEKLRRIFLFNPDDTNYLEQVPPPSRNFAVSKDGKLTVQYRSPAPGSRTEIVRQPMADVDTQTEDPYDISYYTRDTTRRYENQTNIESEKLKLELMDETNIHVEEEMKKLEERPNSSCGNKGVFATGKSNFDPTGLRSSMSATHESLVQSLDANMPDHLPYPVWWNNQDEIVEWYKERNLPVPIGKTGYGTVPTYGRVSRW